MLEHFSDSGFAGQLQANSVVLADIRRYGNYHTW